jgi:predicted RNA binding protein YcfA (HicA-like mRNA interferase family)
MKRQDLDKKLKKAGWKIIHGGKHDKAVKDGVDIALIIPRHKEISENLAKQILKDAGI